MTFSNQELKKSWERETGKLEEFIPEFDIEVKIKDARPDDQNYISNIATMALQLGAIGEEAYWKAILEGKLPRIEDIMAELQAKRQMMAESIKYGLIIVASLPIIAVYPLIQKHFVKGGGNIRGERNLWRCVSKR